MAPHSSTLAWKIPWMEEPGRLSVWREDSGLLSRKGRKRRPSPREDGGFSGVSSSCGVRGAFLTTHDEVLREPLMRRQGSQVSMSVARGSASLFSSPGRGLGHQGSRASLGQSLVDSLLPSPRPCYAEDFICSLQESVSQSCVSSGGSVVGLMVISSKRAYAIPRSPATRAPVPAAVHC